MDTEEEAKVKEHGKEEEEEVNTRRRGGKTQEEIERNPRECDPK